MRINDQTSEQPIGIRLPGIVGIAAALASLLMFCVSAYILFQDINVQGNIETVNVEHNVYDASNRKGMRIHVRFTVKNKMGGKCRAVGTFYYADGTPLKDFNNLYTSIDRNVSVDMDFVPNYQNTLYEDFQLFMPYDELHMKPGEADLKFNVSLYDYKTDRNFATSEDQPFHLSSGTPTTSSSKLPQVVPTQNDSLMAPTAAYPTPFIGGGYNPDELPPETWFPMPSEIWEGLVGGDIREVTNEMAANGDANALELFQTWGRITSYDRFYSHPEGCNSSDIYGVYIQIFFFQSPEGSQSFYDWAHEGYSVKLSNAVGDEAYIYSTNRVEGGCQTDIVATTFQHNSVIGRARVYGVDGKMDQDAIETLSLQISRIIDDRIRSELK